MENRKNIQKISNYQKFKTSHFQMKSLRIIVLIRTELRC